MRTGSARTSGGFTYMLLLSIVAIIAAASASALSLGLRMERAGAERELAWCERQYARAIARYAAATPGVAHGPRTVAELLLDSRRPGVVRHLRHVYVNPVTMGDDWRVFRDRAGWIVAVCRPLASVDPPTDGARREQDDPCAPYATIP